jgi:hypothetical protein
LNYFEGTLGFMESDKVLVCVNTDSAFFSSKKTGGAKIDKKRRI